MRRSTKSVMEASEHHVDQSARDTANEAIAKSVAHESLCNERWRTQGETMARVETTMQDIKKAIDVQIAKVPAAIIAALMGLLGWMAARAFPLH